MRLLCFAGCVAEDWIHCTDMFVRARAASGGRPRLPILGIGRRSTRGCTPQTSQRRHFAGRLPEKSGRTMYEWRGRYDEAQTSFRRWTSTTGRRVTSARGCTVVRPVSSDTPTRCRSARWSAEMRGVRATAPYVRRWKPRRAARASVLGLSVRGIRTFTLVLFGCV